MENLFSSFPLGIVLVFSGLVFLFFFVKSSKKYYGNYTNCMVRLNDLYAENVEAMKKQNEILSDIAETLKERNKKG